MGCGVAHPREFLAWTAVRRSRDKAEVVGVVLAEVGAFGEVLAQQAVGVLVGAALPGAGRGAEIDLEAGGHLDLEGVPHLLARVPGQRLPDEPRQLLGGSNACLFILAPS